MGQEDRISIVRTSSYGKRTIPKFLSSRMFLDDLHSMATPPNKNRIMVGFIYKFQKDMVTLKCNHNGEERD